MTISTVKVFYRYSTVQVTTTIRTYIHTVQVPYRSQVSNSTEYIPVCTVLVHTQNRPNFESNAGARRPNHFGYIRSVPVQYMYGTSTVQVLPIHIHILVVVQWTYRYTCTVFLPVLSTEYLYPVWIPVYKYSVLYLVVYSLYLTHLSRPVYLYVSSLPLWAVTYSYMGLYTGTSDLLSHLYHL